MTNERLEEIRRSVFIGGPAACQCALCQWPAELIAEIDRLRGELDEERNLRRSWELRCDEAIGAGKAICETAKQLNAENDLLQASAFKWEKLHDNRTKQLSECQTERDQWKAECERLARHPFPKELESDLEAWRKIALGSESEGGEPD